MKRPIIWAVAMLALTSSVAAAQPYPIKPIRFIVPFAPGGTTDIIARLVGQKLAESLGQQLVVDNRGGAGGTIATDTCAKAAGDGYTLMMNHSGMTYNATLYAKLPYDTIRDIAPIAMVGVTPNVMVVNPSVAAKTVREFIATAKAKTDAIVYGSGGHGSSAHLAVELFQSLTATSMVHVPYKGAGPALGDLVGGQIQMMIATMPATVGHIRSGRIRPIAVSGTRRSPAFPDLPTIAEAGVPGYHYTTWYGILGPASLLRALVLKLNQVNNTALAVTEFRDRLAQSGLEAEVMTPERFASIIKADVDKWGKIIRSVGIKAD